MMTEAMVKFIHKMEKDIFGKELVLNLCSECEHLGHGCYCEDLKSDGCNCKDPENYPACGYYFEDGDYCDCPCHCPDNCDEHDKYNCQLGNLSPDNVENSVETNGLVLCWEFSYDDDVMVEILKSMSE